MHRLTAHPPTCPVARHAAGKDENRFWATLRASSGRNPRAAEGPRRQPQTAQPTGTTEESSSRRRDEEISGFSGSGGPVLPKNGPTREETAEISYSDV